MTVCSCHRKAVEAEAEAAVASNQVKCIWMTAIADHVLRSTHARKLISAIHIQIISVARVSPNSLLSSLAILSALQPSGHVAHANMASEDSLIPWPAVESQFV